MIHSARAVRKPLAAAERRHDVATQVVPLISVEYPEQHAFPDKVCDTFYEEGLADDDPFASIFRVRVVQEIDRDEMRQTLRTRLAPRGAGGLIWVFADP